ncbi:MAG: hypothetical protein AB7T08_13160, partial [Hyphomonadaceae bacterium]
PDYDALKRECAFRLKLHAPGFSARETIAPGDGFYDILLGYIEDDGALMFSDIGGQPEIGWDPERGHGSIWRRDRSGAMRCLVPAGATGRAMILQLRKAPAHYGPWGGHIFYTGQTEPGRPGATKPHAVFRVSPGAAAPELFVVMPDNGSVCGGVAGSLMPGCFGRAVGPFADSLFVYSIMNCTIYRITPDAKATPFITLDRPEGPIMPVRIDYAPDWWGEAAGELVLHGARNAHFESPRPPPEAFSYWRISPAGAIEELPKPPTPLRSVQAPAEFGPFGGDVFFVDEGNINLAQISGCDEHTNALPYGGRILRWSKKDGVSVFADDFQGSSTSLLFDRSRLYVGLVRKSYCTGEFHEPDASLYEIDFVG